MSVRIATFNVENLMERFDFSGWRKAVLEDRSRGGKKHRLARDHELLEQARIIAYEDDSRQMTALAIADCHADIVCLQEVENLDALESFEKNYLLPMTGLSYPQKEWVQGNDGRGIDVALMARKKSAGGEKIEILSVKSHAKRTFGDMGVHNQALEDMGYEAHERLFRRDCLEVDMRLGGKMTTLFVCHFKSMGSSKEGLSGRKYTMPVRVAEAEGVRRIIEEKFGTDRVAEMRWLVCGDLNDYTERLAIDGNKQAGYTFNFLAEDHSGIDPLLRDGFSEDLVGRRSDEDRWSLYFAAGESKNTRDPETRPVRHLVQLDYFLASPAIVRANKGAVPDIIRSGQPYRTIFPPGQDVDRYPRTGWDRPKASDHCPLAVTLKIV
ncbi:MAG: endonuclease/exonuclease/phosphatase family protein [Rhizobiaceae bacterium]